MLANKKALASAVIATIAISMCGQASAADFGHRGFGWNPIAAIATVIGVAAITNAIVAPPQVAYAAPAPVYYGPPQGAYAAPAPAYYPAPVAYYAPAPAYYGVPAVYVGGPSRYYAVRRGYR